MGAHILSSGKQLGSFLLTVTLQQSCTKELTSAAAGARAGGVAGVQRHVYANVATKSLLFAPSVGYEL